MALSNSYAIARLYRLLDVMCKKNRRSRERVLKESVTVWDDPNAPVYATGTVLFWEGYGEQPGCISIPRYVESHADRLRKRYLAFIHDLGEHVIDGKPVVEHLALSDGFSFWWMTQLAEKSPFKSPQLFSCLRLLALEDILLKHTPSVVTLETGNHDLESAVRVLCKNLCIEFVCRVRAKEVKPWTARRFYEALPYWAQGALSFRHLIKRWRLRGISKRAWFFSDRTVFFCSYFFNLDLALGALGRFEPRQWQGLPAFLSKHGNVSNWIHHFLPSPAIPDPDSGLKWMRRFNLDPQKQGNHSFLESYLSWRLVITAASKWLWLIWICWRVRSVREAFYPKGSAVWLWPFLRHDWYTSLNGATAVSNCLWVELFDAALSDIPRQHIGFYIWENQGWECALLRAWRRHSHGNLFGVPHATIVFWHLNNFDDQRSVEAREKYSKPLPDALAVNGRMARNAFLGTGYPEHRLIEVEALRFQYLSSFDSHPLPSQHRIGELKRVLILGDFTIAQTRKMLQCIESALPLLTTGPVSLSLKPHPVCPVKKEDFSTLDCDITEQPLSEIVRDFDFAFSSNTSSAGLDALLAGLPVIVYLDGREFNLSPLRGISGAKFVASPGELAEALQTINQDSESLAARDFFCLEPSLPRWRRLLSRSTPIK